MLFYFLAVFGIYFLLLVMLVAGWIVAQQEKEYSANTDAMISVIIPFRDEQDHLPRLLASLNKLNYRKDNFEVIFVNDHSSDQSPRVVEAWKNQHHHWRIQIIDLKEETGKKAAIEKGVEVAAYAIIATTDADSELPVDWLESISALQPHHQLSFGLVEISATDFWSRLQQMEFFSVMGVTLAAWGWRKPIMCNGANLAFRREAFQLLRGYEGNRHLASGDDEFLLRKIVDRFGASAITWHRAHVKTQPQLSIGSFIEQRIRWASKWKHNTSLSAKTFALIMFVVQASWFPLVAYQLWYDDSYAGVLIAGKLLLEFLVLFNVALHFNARYNLLIFLMLQFVHAPYVIFVAIGSRARSVIWKGRPITARG